MQPGTAVSVTILVGGGVAVYYLIQAMQALSNPVKTIKNLGEETYNEIIQPLGNEIGRGLNALGNEIESGVVQIGNAIAAPFKPDHCESLACEEDLARAALAKDACDLDEECGKDNKVDPEVLRAQIKKDTEGDPLKLDNDTRIESVKKVLQCENNFWCISDPKYINEDGSENCEVDDQGQKINCGWYQNIAPCYKPGGKVNCLRQDKLDQAPITRKHWDYVQRQRESEREQLSALDQRKWVDFVMKTKDAQVHMDEAVRYCEGKGASDEVKVHAKTDGTGGTHSLGTQVVHNTFLGKKYEHGGYAAAIHCDEFSEWLRLRENYVFGPPDPPPLKLTEVTPTDPKASTMMTGQDGINTGGTAHIAESSEEQTTVAHYTGWQPTCEDIAMMPDLDAAGMEWDLPPDCPVEQTSTVFRAPPGGGREQAVVTHRPGVVPSAYGVS